MSIRKLTKAFIAKSDRVNDPLEQLTETEQYDGFMMAIASGIYKQGLWVAKAIKNLDWLPDDIRPLTSDEQQKLQRWLENNMPKLSVYVNEDKVFKFYKFSFEWGVRALYERWALGKMTGFKKAVEEFVLTDQFYIGSLKNQANYLLNKSSLDETTRARIITMIRDGKLNSLTIDEVSTMISTEFEDISATRAFTIARTETCQAMSSGQMAGMRESGVRTKQWVVAGANVCPICDGNASEGLIDIGHVFSSGDDAPPGHPNCECYIEAGEIDLSSVSIWDGE